MYSFLYSCCSAPTTKSSQNVRVTGVDMAEFRIEDPLSPGPESFVRPLTNESPSSTTEDLHDHAGHVGHRASDHTIIYHGRTAAAAQPRKPLPFCSPLSSLSTTGKYPTTTPAASTKTTPYTTADQEPPHSNSLLSRNATQKQLRLVQALDLPEMALYPTPPGARFSDPEDVRKQILLDFYRCFALDMHRGLSLHQLVSTGPGPRGAEVSENLAEVHVQLLDTLNAVKIDEHDGNLVEFPLRCVTTVYRLVRAGPAPAGPSRATPRGAAPVLPEFGRGGGGSDEVGGFGGGGYDSRSFSAAAAQHGCSTTPPQHAHLAVLEFRNRKLAFSFREMQEAQRFVLCLELLIRRAKQQWAKTRPPPATPPTNLRTPLALTRGLWVSAVGGGPKGPTAETTRTTIEERVSPHASHGGANESSRGPPREEGTTRRHGSLDGVPWGPPPHPRGGEIPVRGRGELAGREEAARIRKRSVSDAVGATGSLSLGKSPSGGRLPPMGAAPGGSRALSASLDLGAFGAV